MRICIISNRFDNNVLGGTEICVQSLVKELSKRGIRVVVITISTQVSKFSYKMVIKNQFLRIYRINPINVYNLCKNNQIPLILKPFFHIFDIYNIQTYLIVKKILKREKISLVHTHNLINLSLSVILAAKCLGIPVIHTLHDYWLICPRGTLLHQKEFICTVENRNFLCTLYSWSKFFANKYIDVVISPSSSLLNIHKEFGFFKSKPSLIIPNGIDLEEKKFIKKNLGKTLEILFIGQLVKPKGIYILLNAIKKINIPYSLKIVGNGHEYNNIKKITSKNPKIHVLGRVEHNQIDSLYETANITLIPSIWMDNFPTVILESLSNSTPVIASNIGGIPEIITNDVNGILFNPSDSRKLSSILVDIFLHKEIYENIQINTFRSLEKFSLKKQIKMILTLYTKIVK
ncbi:MAG: glycosyltransferase family 4 protein [Candidatus Hodarchaeota archaeon]